MIRQKLTGILVTVISAAVLCGVWYAARHTNEYYLKAATLAPLGIIGGLFITCFPHYSGKPETTREKVVVLAVFVIGAAVGLYNLYLIDPQFFEFI